MAALIRCFTTGTGFILSDGLAAPTWCNEAESGSLIATARAFAFRGFAYQITPIPRPVGYLANGSFHGELLSVHKTNTSFTDAPEAQRHRENH